MNVLADKPWIIASTDMPKLQLVLDQAEKKGVVAYDIMTERFEITQLSGNQLWSRRHRVEVLHTQEKRGIRRPREQPREQRRAQVAEVKRTRWAGRKAANRHDGRHHGRCAR